MRIIEPINPESIRGESGGARLARVAASTSIVQENDDQLIVPSLYAECPTEEACSLDLEYFLSSSRRHKNICWAQPDGSFGGIFINRSFRRGARKGSKIKISPAVDGYHTLRIGSVTIGGQYCLMDMVPGQRVVMHELGYTSKLSESPDHQLLLNLISANNCGWNYGRVVMAQTIMDGISRALDFAKQAYMSESQWPQDCRVKIL